MQAAYLVIVIITVVSSITLGLITYRKDPKSSTNRLLALITFIVSGWSAASYFSISASTIYSALFWTKAEIIATTLLAPTIFIFLEIFPNKEFKLSTWKVVMTVIVTLVITLIAISKLTFPSFSIGDGVKVLVGPGIIFYDLSIIGFLLAGFWAVAKRYNNSNSSVKLRLKYLILGLVLTFSLYAITSYVFAMLFGFTNFLVLGPTFFLFMVALATYSLVKENPIDIKIITTRLFSVAIWIVLFSKLFGARTPSGLIIDAVVFVIVFVFSVLLIKSVKNEVKQREKLVELNERLKELDKQKDTFISMAAHELRAPMTAIKGYVTMVMEGDTGDIPEKARGFLADANAINERLIRLVNNMLNVSRIEEGRMVYQEEEENLSNPVRAVFSQFAPEAERKGLKYTLSIPKKIKDKVKVDPDRIQEVIGNLISNAVKYTDEGFVKVALTQPRNKYVKLEVSDSGPGISVDEQDKLFQKFQRVESNVGKTTGSGLGLYISKLLIEKFSGRVGLKSEAGKGSIFWFELPLVK